MFTISEFARLGQVSPRMLRHYDEAQLLVPARVDEHTDTGSRTSPNSDGCIVWWPCAISVYVQSVQAASVIHQGSMDTIADSFDALIRWTRDSGHTLDGSSRELYHEWHEDDPTRHITELQLPLGL